MAAKKKAAKTGVAGLWAAGKAARNHPYVERLIDDKDLRDKLRTAFESSRLAYERIDGRGPGAVVDDKKTQKQVKEAARSLRDAAAALRGAKRGRRRKRRGGFLLVLLVGGGAAVALNEGLRKKALDLLFGAEEEFEYSSVTAAQSAPPPGGSVPSATAAG